VVVEKNVQITERFLTTAVIHQTFFNKLIGIMLIKRIDGNLRLSRKRLIAFCIDNLEHITKFMTLF